MNIHLHDDGHMLINGKSTHIDDIADVDFYRMNGDQLNEYEDIAMSLATYRARNTSYT